MSQPHISSLALHYATQGPITCENLSENVNVIYGYNEAGKSRVRDFLEWIMFASSEEILTLKTSATKKAFAHLDPTSSGSATIIVNGESVAISQELVDGITQSRSASYEVLPRDVSRVLTDGLSREHYNNVFSLSLDALSHAESNKLITEDELMNMFFGAGMTGSGVSPPALVGELARQKDAMFSEAKQAKNKKINSILKELTDEAAAVKELRAQEKELESVDSDLVDYNNKLSEIDAHLEKMEDEIVEKKSIVENADNFATYELINRREKPLINSELISHIVDITMLIQSCKEHIDQGEEVERDRLISVIASSEIEQQRQDEELSVTISPDAIDLTVRTPHFVSIVEEEDRARTSYGAELKSIRDQHTRYSNDLALLAREAEQQQIEIEEAEKAIVDAPLVVIPDAAAEIKPPSRIPVLGVIGVLVGIAAGVAGLALGQPLAAILGLIIAATAGAFLFVSPRTNTQVTSAVSPTLGNQEGLFIQQARRDLASKHNKINDFTTQIEKLLEEQKALEDGRTKNSHAFISAVTAAGFPSDVTPHLVSLYIDAYKSYAERAQRIADLKANREAIDSRLAVIYERAEKLRSIAQGTQGETIEEFHSLGDIHTWASALLNIAQEHQERESALHEADRQLRELEKSLSTQFSSIENARTIYSSVHTDDVALQLEQLIEQKDIVEAERKEIDHTIIRLNLERDNASKSTQIADTTQHIQQLTEELKARHEQYLGLYVAHSVVIRALENFRRDNQPELLRVASTMMDKVTQGEWKVITVEQSDSSRSQPIIRVSGARAPHGLSIAQLSRGTREQLYLCLRLALMQTSTRGKEIPVLFDDIAVNSDRARFQALAPVIREIGQSRQVIYFTCHESTRDILEQYAGARVITI